MPLSMLGSFGASANFTPTDVPQVFTGSRSAYVVYTDRNVYMRILSQEDLDAGVTVTPLDFLFTSAEGYARIRLDDGGQVAFLLEPNDVAGGILKFTRAGDDW